MYFGMGLRFARTGPQRYGDAARLFSQGEQGFWYDHNDLLTLFQDTAGTIPGAVGMPVALKLDKSGNGNHATQATAASRPILRLNATTGFHYLETDGVDDGMVTAPIDFTGTDKVSVFSGVRKLSDADTGALVEISVDSALNNGSFTLLAPSFAGANSYRLQVRGTDVMVAGTGVFAAAPDSAVIKGVGDISGDFVQLRRNGAIVQTTTGDLGTGNFGNYPLYLYRRAGPSLQFNGHSYGEICTGRLTTAAETAAIEQYFALRAGVTLA